MPYYLSPHLINVIFERMGSRTSLFPRLKLLSWQCGGSEASIAHDQLLQLLTPPTLSVFILWHPHREQYGIHYEGWVDSYAIPQHIETVAARASNLRHFLSELYIPSGALHALSDCQHLRSITVRQSSVALPFLEHISRAPKLEELTVSLGPEGNSSQIKEDRARDSHDALLEFGSQGFASLKRLHLYVDDPRVVCAALVPMSDSCLNASLATISIEFRGYNGADKDPDILQALQCLSRFHALRSINISIESADTEPTLSFSEFATPLFYVSQAEEVSFTVNKRLTALSDRDVQQMTQAWPNLTHLHISNDHVSRQREIYAYYEFDTEEGEETVSSSVTEEGRETVISSPSLGAVVRLAQQCIHLEAVAINIGNVSEADIASIENLAESRILQDKLRLFLPAPSLYHWKVLSINDIDRLAAALYHLFPKISGSRTLRDYKVQERLHLSRYYREPQGNTHDLMTKLDELARERERKDCE